MRLLNYGVGDACDRLTILSLKVLHGEAAGKDVSHFRNERNGLLTKVRSAGGSWLDELLQLGAVNAALWTATDDLRDRSLDPREARRDHGWCSIVAALGLRIMELNDERARLVASINAQVGDGFEEKQ